MPMIRAQAMSTAPTRFRWRVMALIFVIYLVAAADRANIGIVLPYVRDEFDLTNTQAGTIASLFFLAYGIGQIPAAYLIRRFGVRRVLPVSLFLTSLATAFHGLVGSVLALKACRIALGAAEAPIVIGCITSVNNWFPQREKGTAAGLFIAAGKLAPVIAPPIGAAIILTLGWQYVFLLFALPGLLLPWVWQRSVGDHPERSNRVNAAEAQLIAECGTQDSAASARPTSASGACTGLQWLDRLIRARSVEPITTSRGAFGSWNIWGASLSYFLFVGTMNVMLTWIPTYLADVKGFSIMGIGFMAGAPFAGGVAGNLAGGWISDRLLDRRRKPLMLLSCAASLVMLLALRSSPDSPPALAALLALTGFSLGLGFALFGIFSASLTDRATFPIATSILNTCGQMGGAALPFFTGVLLDVRGWDEVFLMLSAAAGLALLLLLTIVEPRPGAAPLVHPAAAEPAGSPAPIA